MLPLESLESGAGASAAAYSWEESELRLLKKELEGNVWQFISSYDRDYMIDYIESMASTRKPQRDETVGELLKLFCNKNSKRVREARLKLKVYYEHRSPAEWNSAQYRGRLRAAPCMETKTAP